MHDHSGACPVCGAAPAGRVGVLELDLGDDGFDVALARVPDRVARVARRLPRVRGRRRLGAVVVLGVAVAAVNAFTADPDRAPAVLPTVVTTTAPAADPIDAAPVGPLFGEATGLRLVVLAAPDLAAVDLDSGIVTPIDTDLVSRSAGAPAVATSSGLAYVDRDGGVSLAGPGRDATSRPLLAATAGRTATAVLGEGPVGRLWVTVDGADGVAAVGSIALDGGGELTVAGAVPVGAPVRADGIGGVVVGAPGGVYRLVTGQPPTRLTSGDLLDARDGHVLTMECDDALACAAQVLDLADGTRRRTPVPATGGGTLSLAPDGRVLRAGPGVLEVVGADGAVVALDASGVTCADGACSAGVRWSPDGRWLVGVTGAGTVWAWRTDWSAPQVAPAGAPDVTPISVGSIVAVTTLSA